MSYETRKAPLTVYVTMPPEAERLSMLDAQAKGLVACDGLLIIPMWQQEGKDPYTQRAITYGPDGQPLPDQDLWRLWSLLGFDLSSRPGLSPALQLICKMVNALIESTLSGQGKPPEAPKPSLIAEAPPPSTLIITGR